MPDVTIKALRGLALGAITALATLATPAALEAQSLFSPAITVNGDVISRYELDQREQFLRLLGAPSNPTELATEQLIEDRLKFQAAAEIGVTVSPEDLRAGMEEFAGRANLSVDEFVAQIGQGGVSEQTFRDFVEVGLIWRDVVRSRFIGQSRPSESEIDRAIGSGGGSGGLRVLLSEIVMPLTPTNQAAVRARAEEIAQIKSFDAFSAQAREVSATNTRDQGGRMDWVALNDLPPALRPAILALSPGDVTPPLQLPNAIALFQLRDVAEIVGQAPSYAAIEYATYFIPGGRTPEALKTGRDIENRIDTCDDLYGIAKGETGTLQREALPPGQIPDDIAVELAKLDAGETSLALTRNNGTVLVLLMLCGRTAAANEDASREDVANALTAQRLEAFAASYLDQLEANALIVTK